MIENKMQINLKDFPSFLLLPQVYLPDKWMELSKGHKSKRTWKKCGEEDIELLNMWNLAYKQFT
jgi:hypothetical protein